ncbi:MAG: UDP-N-acetylmuramoyl-L-alanyl-D-glutamate--2,6-diaminopimelate ligase [Erysipelotrichales bacterium]|nr:UDP-N-acetylmuramoyl-L-alanyl-D-glutamate--2,6-diaminopimelate ligase [Erysipelotrichales bacterium]
MRIDKALRFFNITVKDKRVAKHLICDSRKIKEQSIFIAIDNGINYINDLKIKPLIILSNVKRNDVIYIPNLKDVLSEFGIYFYKLKKKHPTLIGIVGTNGKTSTANILHNLLPKSLLITTISNVNDSIISDNTTPNAIELVNDIVYARENKYQYVILEVSSIGIKEKRVEGLDFSYLVFLNLSKDHLDYHKTLKDYQETKVNFILKSNATTVINANDKFGRFLLNQKENSYPYKFESSIIKEKSLKGTLFSFENHMIYTNLIGDFNIENLISVLTLLKVMKKRINYSEVSSIKPIKGRMDVISYSPNIIIDYAHTSPAFEMALKELKNITKGKLVVVFGAGGNRDKTKRKEYGDSARQYADEIILTNDNPRNENQEEIISDINALKDEKVTIILDRHEAIKEGVKRLTKNDTLAIIGKGHEEYQIIGNKKYHFSDYEEVRKWL